MCRLTVLYSWYLCSLFISNYLKPANFYRLSFSSDIKHLRVFPFPIGISLCFFFNGWCTSASCYSSRRSGCAAKDDSVVLVLVDVFVLYYSPTWLRCVTPDVWSVAWAGEIISLYCSVVWNDAYDYHHRHQVIVIKVMKISAIIVGFLLTNTMVIKSSGQLFILRIKKVCPILWLGFVVLWIK